jgi:uncharacterized membrane protein
MSKQRMEAFSDGVIAILITVMVLELRPPEGTDWLALRVRIVHDGLSYVLSFGVLSLFWNQHHHMLQATHRINGRILVANTHFLFWLSLVPFVTAWIRTGEALPAAAYGVVAFCAGGAFMILQRALIAENGVDSRLAKAIGRDTKGMLSAFFYAAAVPLAFLDSRIAIGIYALIPVFWLVPDPRIESKLRAEHADQ